MNSTLKISQDTPVAAIPKKKRGKGKIYRVTVKSSGESASDHALHNSIFESIFAISQDGQDMERGS